MNLRLGRSQGETVSPVSDRAVFSRVLSQASIGEQAELSRAGTDAYLGGSPAPSPPGNRAKIRVSEDKPIKKA